MLNTTLWGKKEVLKYTWNIEPPPERNKQCPNRRIADTGMGVRRNFPRGETLTFCLSFSGCWRWNANGRSQNASLSTSKKILYVTAAATASLTLTMDFLNLWNNCYRFTHAFHTASNYVVLSAKMSVFRSAVLPQVSLQKKSLDSQQLTTSEKKLRFKNLRESSQFWLKFSRTENDTTHEF